MGCWAHLESCVRGAILTGIYTAIYGAGFDESTKASPDSIVLYGRRFCWFFGTWRQLVCRLFEIYDISLDWVCGGLVLASNIRLGSKNINHGLEYGCCSISNNGHFVASIN